jgi:ornithine cyclodeaminase
VPPVGELFFDEPPGEAHIKYGYVQGDPYFIVKIATGFYDNVSKGLPNSSGVLLAFDRRTGIPAGILLDEGLLTNIRTAAAGALASRLLAGPGVNKIAVIGGGVQARLQLEFLKPLFPSRKVSIWARRREASEKIAQAGMNWGFSTEVAATPVEAVADADLIVTATASTVPLIRAADLKPGAHVTAIGADTSGKQELHEDVFERADLIAVDSISQARLRGNTHRALAAGLEEARITEIGNILAGKLAGRRRDEDITLADLTGVAVQDIAMVNEIFHALERS